MITSLEVVDDPVEEGLNSLVGLAADLGVDSFSLPGELVQVGRVHFLVVALVADYVDGASPAVVLHLPQPILDALQRLLRSEVHQQNDQRGLLVHLVPDLQEIEPAAEIPKCDVDRPWLERDELVVCLDSQCGLVEVGARIAEALLNEGRFSGLLVADQSDLDLYHFLGGRHVQLLGLFQHNLNYSRQRRASREIIEAVAHSGWEWSLICLILRRNILSFRARALLEYSLLLRIWVSRRVLA